MTFEVGNEVVRREYSARQRSDEKGYTESTGTVVKVARKYCTVEFRSVLLGVNGNARVERVEFDKETGYRRRGPNGFGVYADRIDYATGWKARDRRREMIEELGKLGVTFTTYSLRDNLSFYSLQLILSHVRGAAVRDA